MDESVSKFGTLLVGPIINTVMTAIATYVIAMYKASQRELKAQKESNKILLRYCIMQIHESTMSKGEITALMLDSTEKMYAQYKEYGDDGMVREMMGEIRELHIKRGVV